jgi:uncharacterized membrane protein YkvA (DUF1232 family)
MTFPLQSVYNWYRKLVAHPKYRWWVIAGTLVYLLDPFDFMPDMIPLVGQIDDAVLVTLVATELTQVVRDRLQASKNQASKNQPTAQATATASPAIAIDTTAVAVK